MINYISVLFEATKQQAEIITALLMDRGYEGAVENENITTISIQEQHFQESELKELMDQQQVAYTFAVVPQQNWNAQWESSFEPVQVDDFALIRASFHEKKASVLHDIIITPKMSFGTGHHATTYLVIQQMEELDFKDKSVIDFGTGTGVLAILAEKMGAASVYAVDNDEWSINNSIENIEANRCSRVALELAHEMRHREKADIILANINLNVIIDNIDKIKAALHSGGSTIFSGLLTADEDKITNVLIKNGFKIRKVTHRNGWIAILTS